MATTVESAGEVISQTKNEVSIQTTEIVADERIICEYVKPVEYKIPTVFTTRKFHCSHPTVDPNVVRVTEPLPFPVKLQELIAWTDAFVDRIASQTHEEEKRTTYVIEHLESELDRLAKRLLGSQEKLKLSQKDVIEAKKVNAKLTQDLNKSNILLEEQKTLTQQAEKKAKAEASRADDLKKQLDRALSDDAADDATIEKLNRDRNALEYRRAILQKLYEETSLKLAKEVTSNASNKKLIEQLKNRIIDMKAEIRTKITKIADLKTNLKGVTSALEQTKVALKSKEEENKVLNGKCEDGLNKIAEHVKTIADSENTIKNLNDKIEKLTTEKAALNTQKDEALKELEKTKTTNEALQGDIQKTQEDITNKDIKVQKLEAVIESLKAATVKAEGDKVLAESRAAEAAATAASAQATVTKLQHQLTQEQVNQKNEIANGLLVAKNDIESLKESLAEANKRVVPVTVPGKRINILTVEYGGKAYTYENNKSVFDKLYSAAEKRTSFDISNGFFEGDPRYGVVKTASITYQLSSSGAALQIVGVENTKAEFK